MSIAEFEQAILEIKRKTRLTLIATVLEHCENPKSKSSLFYELRCTYKVLNPILKKAVKSKLVIENNGMFQTTTKGREYLTKFEELLSLLQ